jgi:hypothetical protein
VTHEEWVNKFVHEIASLTPDEFYASDLYTVVQRIVDYGYALASLEVAERDAKRNGAPEREGEGDAPRKQV